MSKEALTLLWCFVGLVACAIAMYFTMQHIEVVMTKSIIKSLTELNKLN